MIKITDIPITQNGVRDWVQTMEMAKFVKAGGIFNDEVLKEHHTSTAWARNRILVAQLDDGARFIHDGHHRMLGIYLGGRDFLYEEEIETFDIRYDQYQEVNFATGWLTPFCIVSEVRLPNVHEFKRFVKSLPQESAEAWVRSHRHLYCDHRRDLMDVIDLAEHLGFDRI